MSDLKRFVTLVLVLFLSAVVVATTILSGSVEEAVSTWILVAAIAFGILGSIVTVIVLAQIAITGKKEKLVRKERHMGVVVSMDYDYTLVTLQKPTGEEYQRYFDTNFLMACGVGTVGEELELAFRTTVDGASGTVSMHMAKIGEAPRFTEEELEELFGSVDLEKIRAAFGSHLRPE